MDVIERVVSLCVVVVFWFNIYDWNNLLAYYIFLHLDNWDIPLFWTLPMVILMIKKLIICIF